MILVPKLQISMNALKKNIKQILANLTSMLMEI